MNTGDIEELKAALDDATMIFARDPDEVIVTFDGEEELMSGSLSKMVDTLLDLMETDEEVDDMLDMSRHFAHLAKRIRRAVGDHVSTPRGEP